jgi:PAS domain S-box-containing protein/putative nucleotidyltransferase with HDIG domain
MSIADYAKRFVPPEEAFLVGQEIRKSAETDDPNFNRYLEHRMLYADGSVGHIAVRYFIVKDDKGRTIKTYGVNQDITERKRAEDVLRESEEKFRELIEHGSEAILLIDAQGTIFFGSPATERLLGYSSQEFLGRSGLDDVHPDDLKSVREILARLVSEPGSTQRLEYRLRHKDGTWRWIDTFAKNSLHVPAVHGIVLNSRDITERKQAELKIQEQLERLTALSEVDQAIASRSDVQVSLNLLLSRAIHLLAVDAAAVLLLDPFRNILEYKAEIGIHMNATQNASVTLRTRLAERVALEGRMVEFRSGSNEPENQQLADYLRRENFASYHGAPLVVKGKVIGVLEVFSRLLVERDQDWLGFFGALAGHIAIMVDSAKLFNDLQASNLELSLAYDATLEGWSRALEVRDQETKGHSHRVAEMTLRLARAMGATEQDLIHIHRGALLHDIGKLGIPDSILLKASQLNEEERNMIRKHPTIAYEMLTPIAYLRPALDIPYYHHEKWDGTGYPHGLKAEEIPLPARIFAVVDVWDALTSDRPYRKAWSHEKALAYIQEQAGEHFDPQVVDAFLSII